jgi:hypothetical protein
MSDISVRVEVAEAPNPEHEVLALQDWLRLARVRGLRAERETQPRAPSDMGPELLPIITVVLSSTVLAELARALHAWLTSRRRKVAIEVEVEGRRIRLESESGESVESLLKRVEGLLHPDARHVS